MRAYSHGLQDWANANPTVKSWYDRKARDSKNTAEVYLSMVWKYWKQGLALRGYKEISQWVEEVKDQQFSRDTQVRRRWGKELEDWFTATTLMEKSRGLCVWAVTSFLKEHTDLAEYPFSLMERAKKFAERKAHKVAPLKAEEIKRLVNEASTRDKAIFLTQVSGGLGIGEFLEFAKDWKTYEKAIRARTIPLRLDLVRPKTGVEYHTLLWDDSVNALADYLAERERVEKNPEHLFLNQHKHPVRSNDIQWSIRRLADRIGLDPKRPKGAQKAVYRVRPHEFRDYFKTVCENSEVPNNISEFAMGHKVDKLEYNKFSETKEGEERIKLALSKTRAKLNVLTAFSPAEKLNELPYLTEAVEWISLFKTLPKEQVERGILAHLKRSPAFAKELKDFKEPKAWANDEMGLEDYEREVALGMDRTDVFPSVLSYVESLTPTNPSAKKLVQKVIPEGELQKYIDEGWDFRSVINTHSVLVEREGA